MSPSTSNRARSSDSSVRTEPESRRCLSASPACCRRTWAKCSRTVSPVADRTSLLFYVPDGIAPWPAQSVRWVLEFTIGFLGGRAALLDEILDKLDIRPLLDQPFGALSKGQRKRALLAIGLLTPQPALLIDEPFEGLDLRQARDIMTALREHVAGGRTLFLSIHQISDAARFCDRFVLLNAGRVRGEGTLQELASKANLQENLEEVFLALT